MTGIKKQVKVTSNKQSLFKRYGKYMTTFSTNPFFIYLPMF